MQARLGTHATAGSRSYSLLPRGEPWRSVASPDLAPGGNTTWEEKYRVSPHPEATGCIEGGTKYEMTSIVREEPVCSWNSTSPRKSPHFEATGCIKEGTNV